MKVVFFLKGGFNGHGGGNTYEPGQFGLQVLDPDIDLTSSFDASIGEVVTCPPALDAADQRVPSSQGGTCCQH